jgi:hypothetical protein
MYLVFGFEIKSIKVLPAPLFLSCSIKDVLNLFFANFSTLSLVPSVEKSSAIKISKLKSVSWETMLLRALLIKSL